MLNAVLPLHYCAIYVFYVILWKRQGVPWVWLVMLHVGMPVRKFQEMNRKVANQFGVWIRN